MEEPETRQAVSRVRGGGPQVHGRDGENQTHHKRGGGNVSHATPGGAEGATTTRARGPPPRAGLELATSTTEATPSPLERFTEGEWDLLSASPAQLAEAAERRGQTASSSSAAAAVSAPIPPRYVPRGEYTAERASGGAASKHSLLGMSLPPASAVAARASAPPSAPPSAPYPSVDRTRAATPEIRANLAPRPPPPPNPHPSAPSAPPRLLPHHLRPDRLNRRRRRGRIQDVSHRRRRAHRRRRRRRFPRVSSSPGKW